MSRFSNFINTLRGKPTDGGPTLTANTSGLPTKRVSLPDDYSNLIASVNDGMLNYVIPRKWPVQIYDLITNLCLTNADLRQAVGHIVQLGNTGHMLNVSGGNEAVIDAAVERIESQSESIFPFSGGPDGLINSMFAQAARTGAISVEWVPKVDLSGIDKAFLVKVGDIRWVPRRDLMGYYPVQVPSNSVFPTQTNPGTGIPLNLKTYYYANVERLEDSPYAVPPFIAALESVALQKTMFKNIHKIVKKVGIMGLMSYKVAPPQLRPGEGDAKYQQRCMSYLQEVTNQIKENFGEGVAAGFQGSFDFDVKSITSDARGIAEIFKLNEEQLFSAIGADPAMHGRTYSTTETYASVVFSKMISQLCNYQRLVSKGLDFGWGLDLALAGISADIWTSFNKSEALSNLQEAQSDMIEIANGVAKYTQGIIDQQQLANELGYAVPAEDAPRPIPLDPNKAGAGSPQDKNLDQRGGGAANTGNPKKKQPKEQASAQFQFNSFMKKYYHVSPASIHVVNTALETFADDKKNKRPSDATLARYL